jgi:uncharacterized membrane protein SpoIIM required for sporulation
MVLESLIDPLKAKEKPWKLFFYGFLFCSLAIFISLWVFEANASMLFVFLTVLGSAPLIREAIRLEGKKDLQNLSEKTLLKEHAQTLSFFMFLFFGVTLACTLWYSSLPSATLNHLFKSQVNTITAINSQVVSDFSVSTVHFSKIFFNNIKVLVFCILFSFIYGIGAVFILTWNASVIGVAIGNFIRTNLAEYSSLLGFEKVAIYTQVVSFGLLRYLLHGIPEILAYFTAGMAGGIISFAIINHDFSNKKFGRILIDSTDLVLISIFLLFFAALIEVFVTPIFF